MDAGKVVVFLWQEGESLLDEDHRTPLSIRRLKVPPAFENLLLLFLSAFHKFYTPNLCTGSLILLRT